MPDQSSLDHEFYIEKIEPILRHRLEIGAKIIAKDETMPKEIYFDYYQTLHEIRIRYGAAIMDAVADHAKAIVLENSKND